MQTIYHIMCKNNTGNEKLTHYTTSLSYCTKIRVIVILGRSGNSLCGIYVAAVPCTVKCSCAQIFCIP